MNLEQYEPQLRQIANYLGVVVDHNSTEPAWFSYDQFQGQPAPFPLALVIGSAVVYLALVYVIWPLMVPKGGWAVSLAKTLRFWHNIALFLFSAVSFGLTAYHMWALGEFRFDDLRPALCNHPPYWLHFLNFLFVVSKVWEWVDTMWLVWLSPRALSFLHVYHHTTTLWLFLLVSNLPTTGKLGILLNGFVHTLMYAHYAKPFPKAIVPFITTFQIIQMGITTFVWIRTPSLCPEFAYFPDKHWMEFATPFAFVPVYMFLFINFFAQRFIFKKKSKAKKGALPTPAEVKKMQ